jgi:hypothetical protein
VVQEEAMKQPVIRTYTGKMINPLALRPQDIDIEDIAHHLACYNRFNGATIVPINIACHSMLVARIVKYTIDDPSIELQALLHDSPEAYLGDVTKWLKQSPAMAGYRLAELNANNVIMDKFCLSRTQHPSITDADRVAVTFEAQLGFQDPNWSVPKSHPKLTNDEMMAIDGWYCFLEWQRSKDLFLEYFHDLQRRINEEVHDTESD